MHEAYTEASDAALVLAIARYHHEALAEAYRRHGGSVFGLARRLLYEGRAGRSVDVLRSDGARRAREERDARTTAEAGYDIEHEVTDMATADQVRRALDALPPPERQAIELAYFGGRTYREVAAALHEPEGTVKSRIRAGLKRLRVELVANGVTVAGT